MTRNDIMYRLMDITHVITDDIERINEERRAYSPDEVMDLINSYAERLIDLRHEMGSRI